MSRIEARKLVQGDLVRTSSGKVFRFECMASRNCEYGVFKTAIGVTVPLMLEHVERVNRWRA